MVYTATITQARVHDTHQGKAGERPSGALLS
jgi:hypothetical protein